MSSKKGKLAYKPETYQKKLERERERYYSDPEYRARKLAQNRAWRKQNPEKRREYNKRSREKKALWARKKYVALRQAVIEKAAGVCQRCGFEDVRALEVHHVNRNGSKRCALTDLQKMLRGEIEYEVLCANCHAIINYEGNVKGARRKY